MPFTLTGITTVDYLQESGLKSVWEVWREYAYKTSLVVVSLFVLAPQVKFNCVNDPKVEHDQQLDTVGADAVNSYCKTHFMSWHTRYGSVAAFSASIIIYIVSNFWIHIPGNKERLRYLGRFASSILEHHMTLDEMKKVAVEPVESSSDKRSHAVRENVLILLKSGDRQKIWRWYVIRCCLLLIVLAVLAWLSACYFDSLSIFFHGRDDIVTCYILKSAIGLGTGNLTFTCIDEFTMVDSMLEFVFFCAMIGQFICVAIALSQMLCTCKECCCFCFCCKGCCSSSCRDGRRSCSCCDGRCSCSCCDGRCSCSCYDEYNDIPDFVTLMAGLDHEQAEIVKDFKEYVLRDAPKESKTAADGDNTDSTSNGGSKTFKERLSGNQSRAKDIGDEGLSEILKRLSPKSSRKQISSPSESNSANQGRPIPTVESRSGAITESPRTARDSLAARGQGGNYGSNSSVKELTIPTALGEGSENCEMTQLANVGASSQLNATGLLGDSDFGDIDNSLARSSHDSTET